MLVGNFSFQGLSSVCARLMFVLYSRFMLLALARRVYLFWVLLLKKREGCVSAVVVTVLLLLLDVQRPSWCYGISGSVRQSCRKWNQLAREITVTGVDGLKTWWAIRLEWEGGIVELRGGVSEIFKVFDIEWLDNAADRGVFDVQWFLLLRKCAK